MSWNPFSGRKETRYWPLSMRIELLQMLVGKWLNFPRVGIPWNNKIIAEYMTGWWYLHDFNLNVQTERTDGQTVRDKHSLEKLNLLVLVSIQTLNKYKWAKFISGGHIHQFDIRYPINDEQEVVDSMTSYLNNHPQIRLVVLGKYNHYCTIWKQLFLWFFFQFRVIIYRYFYQQSVTMAIRIYLKSMSCTD